jgi:hypothetical protein
MFHWICPECGREIAPTVRECPVCDPSAAPTEPVQARGSEAPGHALAVATVALEPKPEIADPIPAEPMPFVVTHPPVRSRSERRRIQDALTETIELPPGGLAALLEAEERAATESREAASENLESSLESLEGKGLVDGQHPESAPPPVAASVPHVEVVQPAAPDPTQKPKRQDSGRYWLKVSREGHVGWDPLARLEAFARRRAAEPLDPPAPSVPVPALVAPVASEAPLATQVAEIAPVHEEDFDLALPSFGGADLTGDPLDNLVTAMGIEEDAAPPTATEIFAVPGPRAAIPQAFRALISELAPAGQTESIVRLQVPNGRHELPTNEFPQVDTLLATGNDLPRWGEPGDDREVLRSGQDWVETEPMRKPVEPEIPHAVPSPEMAGWVEYLPLAGRPILPAQPPNEIRQRACEPRITLPGPALIKKLVSFQDKELVPVLLQRKAPQKGGVPRWMVTALVLGTLLGAGFSTFFTFVPASAPVEAKSKSAVTKTAEPVIEPKTTDQSDEKSATTAASTAAPLSRAIEVTGFRIQVDAKKKAEIDYLVVNHSPNKLSGVNVFVTLYSTEAKAGEPPLCRFSFAAPDLKPQEAKAMVSSIERFNRPIAVPDWQNIRAEIEIGQ